MTCFRLDSGETLYSWCQQNDLRYCNVVRRIEKGMSVAEAIADASKRLKKGESNRKFFYKGKWVGDYLGGCRSAAYHRVRRRMDNGWTMDEAMKKEGL